MKLQNDFFVLQDESKELDTYETIQCWSDGERIITTTSEVIIVMANRAAIGNDKHIFSYNGEDHPQEEPKRNGDGEKERSNI